MHKTFRAAATLLAVLFLASPASPAFAASGSNASQTAGPGDVTTTLGSAPYFPNGIYFDQYGNGYKSVTDSTTGAPAAVGKVLVWSTGQLWKQSAAATAQFVFGQYGIVVTPASAVGGTAIIQVRGLAQALVVTNGSTAVAFNTPLGTDGSGNLTATTTPVFGAVLATGVTTQAISLGPLLITVWIGNY